MVFILIVFIIANDSISMLDGQATYQWRQSSFSRLLWECRRGAASEKAKSGNLKNLTNLNSKSSKSLAHWPRWFDQAASRKQSTSTAMYFQNSLLRFSADQNHLSCHDDENCHTDYNVLCIAHIIIGIAFSIKHYISKYCNIVSCNSAAKGSMDVTSP